MGYPGAVAPAEAKSAGTVRASPRVVILMNKPAYWAGPVSLFGYRSLSEAAFGSGFERRPGKARVGLRLTLPPYFHSTQLW